MRYISLYLPIKTSTMPRPKRLRKVVAPPAFKAFKPVGNNISKKEAIELYYEEYEALKLADYDSMSQLKASKIMGVSRPTFARIYAAARKKMAQAMVETRTLITVFGHAVLDKGWFLCKDCNAKFTMPAKIDSKSCPLCNSAQYHPIVQ